MWRLFLKRRALGQDALLRRRRMIWEWELHTLHQALLRSVKKKVSRILRVCWEECLTVSSTGTFWDTVVVCLMTGLVLVSTIMKNPNINADQISDGGTLTTLAFGQIPVLGPIILTLGIICFAYSTILGWAYYGERAVEYFAGHKGLIPYRIIYVVVAGIAPIVALDVVWALADILNALMAIPNLIAVLLLSNVVVKETKKYINDLDAWSDEEVPVIED